MLFPEDFLRDFEKQQGQKLSAREWEIFLRLFGKGQTRIQIQQEMSISESALSTSLGGVYSKFSIDAPGPVKQSRLQEVLTVAFYRWQEKRKEPESEDWLTQVRFRCEQRILHNYSEIRLLSGDSISVEQLYIDLWLLNRVPQTVMVSQDKLLEAFDLRDDRLGLGDRVRRVPGFDIADTNQKLLILGKPGSGKTTFMKQLAVDWCKGKFQSNLVTVFLELRQIRDEKWNLLNEIRREIEVVNLQKLKQMLRDGKVLLMMDGFDEVATDQLRNAVRRQLTDLVRDYPMNRFILTCRTQVLSTLPLGFTSVEVADFNDEQVQKFVRKWFQFYEDNPITVNAKCQEFQTAIDRNSAFKELTVTPVLLSLMCLTLKDEGEIPQDRSTLYRRGIRLLLRKWNDSKQLENWQIGADVYRRLSVDEKEELLVKIAAKKFENPTNFVLFEEDELLFQISEKIGLKSSSDSRSVLEAIETQHGLLVERADDLWSFSHLTFQEYFTTKWLLSLSPKQLSQKISNKRWQGVVKQIVKSQGKSDRLIKLIKQAVDQSLSDDVQLQRFLSWINEKVDSLDTQYSSPAMRASYFSIAKALDFDLDFSYAIESFRELDLRLEPGLSSDRTLTLGLVRNQARTITSIKLLERTLLRLQEYKSNTSRISPRFLNRIFQRAIRFADKVDGILASDLERIYMNLPNLSSIEQVEFQFWWDNHSEEWVRKTDQAILKYLSGSNDWRFSHTQNQKLQIYYDTNKFLVNLLKIEDAASEDVQQQIEDNLLLPIEELRRKNPEQYD